jgi:hypothetical protein
MGTDLLCTTKTKDADGDLLKQIYQQSHAGKVKLDEACGINSKHMARSKMRVQRRRKSMEAWCPPPACIAPSAVDSLEERELWDEVESPPLMGQACPEEFRNVDELLTKEGHHAICESLHRSKTQLLNAEKEGECPTVTESQKEQLVRELYTVAKLAKVSSLLVAKRRSLDKDGTVKADPPKIAIYEVAQPRKLHSAPVASKRSAMKLLSVPVAPSCSYKPFRDFFVPTGANDVMMRRSHVGVHAKGKTARRFSWPLQVAHGRARASAAAPCAKQ